MPLPPAIQPAGAVPRTTASRPLAMDMQDRDDMAGLFAANHHEVCGPLDQTGRIAIRHKGCGLPAADLHRNASAPRIQLDVAVFVDQLYRLGRDSALLKPPERVPRHMRVSVEVFHVLHPSRCHGGIVLHSNQRRIPKLEIIEEFY